MPELPEVEVLVRHLAPLLKGKVIRSVQVRRAKVLKPTSVSRFTRTMQGARFTGLVRRGKYLLFTLRLARPRKPMLLLGHLGMTGRMYLAPAGTALPKHAAVVMDLGRQKFIYEDTRYFGRLTMDTGALKRLGPEPLSSGFTAVDFARALSRSAQAVKVRLLDQSVVAGLGNIYASEALFHARISPRWAARRFTREQVRRLWRAIRLVLRTAIACGSTVPLNYSSGVNRDKLFYFGRATDTPDFYEERLQVYDRAGEPCRRCRTLIRRMVQAARSTYYCPRCQGNGPARSRMAINAKKRPAKRIDAAD